MRIKRVDAAFSVIVVFEVFRLSIFVRNSKDAAHNYFLENFTAVGELPAEHSKIDQIGDTSQYKYKPQDTGGKAQDAFNHSE